MRFESKAGRRCRTLAPLALLMVVTCRLQSQTGAEALTLGKIDPPNWWATMPAPMLLVQGAGLRHATFTLSDPALRIKNVTPSENGHWMQLWLESSPAVPETITLRASAGQAHAEAQYTFAARRPESEGFAGFSSKDVLYLIMTDRFADGDSSNDGPLGHDNATSQSAAAERSKPRGWHGGDLRGIQEHLDYLQQLGVTAVWTTPVYQNHEAQSYHGYGATDLYAVDEHYGSLADLKQLAAALHGRGMKLVLDTVPNHIGPQHPWVADEPAPDWFHGTAAKHRSAETNFRALIDPHAPERDRRGTLDGWFADVLPDMNTESPAVAQYLRQNAVWWIEESGADALRVDTFPYVNREFWRDFHAQLQVLYPQLREVGEAFDGNPAIVSSFAGGVTRAGVDTGLYTPFDFPTYFALRDVLTRRAPMSKLADVLAADSLYPHPERLVPFLGNHDTTRIADAVKDDALVRLGFAYVMTTRGMPQIYSGDEIGMSGGGDPDNRHDFPGGFGGKATGAFSEATRSAAQQQMFGWVAQLAAIRREHEALGCGAQQVLAAKDDWLVYVRDAEHAGQCGDGHERVAVALHRGGKAQDSAETLDVELGQTWMAGCVLMPPALAGRGAGASITDDVLHLKMLGSNALIARCR